MKIPYWDWYMSNMDLKLYIFIGMAWLMTKHSIHGLGCNDKIIMMLMTKIDAKHMHSVTAKISRLMDKWIV